MSPAAKRVEVEVEGHRLEVSNLGKVLYPAAGFTKAQVIDYYRRIAPVMLPHIRDRPLTLKRYPDGVEGGHFFEKRCPEHRPGWVRTVEVWSEGNDAIMRFCVCNDAPTLVWLANLAALELHPQLHRGQHQDRPDVVAFDLDPGPPAGLLQCCEVALWLRAVLDELGLQAWPKVSGGKGLQVYVPLNTPRARYQHTKAFARGLAERFAKARPGLVVSKMRKDLRKGKVLVDWSQNDDHKTTVAVYSLRARERPTASCPVTWDEVGQAVADEDAEGLRFEAGEVLARVERLGDLFAPVLTEKQRLPAPVAAKDAA